MYFFVIAFCLGVLFHNKTFFLFVCLVSVILFLYGLFLYLKGLPAKYLGVCFLICMCLGLGQARYFFIDTTPHAFSISGRNTWRASGICDSTAELMACAPGKTQIAINVALCKAFHYFPGSQPNTREQWRTMKVAAREHSVPSP